MTDFELEMIEYMARDGIEPDKIREELGISKKAWARYMRQNPEELGRLKTLKEKTDYSVEDALLRRALGFCEKENAPDVKAAALWLKYRKGQVWDNNEPKQKDESVEKILQKLDEEAKGDAE
jgi:hypothetical protein